MYTIPEPVFTGVPLGCAIVRHGNGPCASLESGGALDGRMILMCGAGAARCATAELPLKAIRMDARIAKETPREGWDERRETIMEDSGRYGVDPVMSRRPSPFYAKHRSSDGQTARFHRF